MNSLLIRTASKNLSLYRLHSANSQPGNVFSIAVMNLPKLTKPYLILKAGIRCYATIHDSRVERTLVLDAIKKDLEVQQAKFRKPALTVFPREFMYKNPPKKPGDKPTEDKKTKQ